MGAAGAFASISTGPELLPRSLFSTAVFLPAWRFSSVGSTDFVSRDSGLGFVSQAASAWFRPVRFCLVFVSRILLGFVSRILLGFVSRILLGFVGKFCLVSSVGFCLVSSVGFCLVSSVGFCLVSSVGFCLISSVEILPGFGLVRELLLVRFCPWTHWQTPADSSVDSCPDSSVDSCPDSLVDSCLNSLVDSYLDSSVDSLT